MSFSPILAIIGVIMIMFCKKEKKHDIGKILVCLGAVLGAVGIYEPFTKWAGAGATVPLLGFGNTLWKGMKEAIDKEGFIGLFKGGFTACSVGVSAALIFGYIASLIFKPKMK